MKRDESVYLRHILDAISKIYSYLENVTEEHFAQKSLLQDGAIRQLEIIGEAVKRISTDMRSQQTHIPWQDIARMRDKLIHDYFGVDIEKVWLTIKEDLPVLEAATKEMLRSLTQKIDEE
jgi:uncharacterized protein with HEPN domain